MTGDVPAQARGRALALRVEPARAVSSGEAA